MRWGQMRQAHVLPRQPSLNPLILGGWGAPGKFPGAAFVMLREESRLSSSRWEKGRGPVVHLMAPVFTQELPPLSPSPATPCTLPERTVALGSLGCSQPWDFTCLGEKILEFTSPLWRRVGGAT